MRLTTLTLLALLLTPLAARAAEKAKGGPKPAPAPAVVPAYQPDVPMKAFPAYAHPEVGCRTVSQVRAECVVPAFAAGRYRIEVTASSTPTGADAAQQIVIQVGGHTCGPFVAADNAKTPWGPGAPHVMKAGCEVLLLTDAQTPIIAAYADKNANKDPKGPSVIVKRAPWDGVLSAQTYIPPQ